MWHALDRNKPAKVCSAYYAVRIMGKLIAAAFGKSLIVKCTRESLNRFWEMYTMTTHIVYVS